MRDYNRKTHDRIEFAFDADVSGDARLGLSGDVGENGKQSSLVIGNLC